MKINQNHDYKYSSSASPLRDIKFQQHQNTKKYSLEYNNYKTENFNSKSNHNNCTLSNSDSLNNNNDSTSSQKPPISTYNQYHNFNQKQPQHLHQYTSSSSTALSPISLISSTSLLSSSSAVSSNSSNLTASTKQNSNSNTDPSSLNKTSPVVFSKYIESVHKALHGSNNENVMKTNRKQYAGGSQLLTDQLSFRSQSEGSHRQPANANANANAHLFEVLNSSNSMSPSQFNLLEISKQFVQHRRQIFEESSIKGLSQSFSSVSPPVRLSYNQSFDFPSESRNLNIEDEDENGQELEGTPTPDLEINSNNANKYNSQFQFIDKIKSSEPYLDLEIGSTQSLHRNNVNRSSSVHRQCNPDAINTDKSGVTNLYYSRANSLGIDKFKYLNMNYNDIYYCIGKENSKNIENDRISKMNNNSAVFNVQSPSHFNHLNRASYKGECKRLMSKAHMETVAERAAHFEEVDKEKFDRLRNKTYALDPNQTEENIHSLKLSSRQHQVSQNALTISNYDYSHSATELKQKNTTNKLNRRKESSRYLVGDYLANKLNKTQNEDPKRKKDGNETSRENLGE